MKKERSSASLEKKEIVLGVCGSIAAYKVPEFIRMLRCEQASVNCILTPGGSHFVTPLTLQSLANNRVYEGMFDPYAWDIEHISLARKADVVAVIPATADAIARMAAGRAEDLLSSVVLATKAPVLVCPAMNANMWTHPATQENVRTLKSYGYHFVDPEEGDLACGEKGPGRLAGLDVILRAVHSLVSP
jgi:phosphopantothenoylcysteine synthetase/decarboxylase